MTRDPKVQLAVLCGGFVLLLAIVGWRLLPGEQPVSPEEVARLALQAPTPEEQEAAAVLLAELGEDARPHLQQVLAESELAEVRAACIQGLARVWDYDSMAVLLDALDDESELVRGRAGMAVGQLLSVDYDYRYDDPPERRKTAVEQFRNEWERFRNSAIFEKWQERRQQRP